MRRHSLRAKLEALAVISRPEPPLTMGNSSAGFARCVLTQRPVERFAARYLGLAHLEWPMPLRGAEPDFDAQVVGMRWLAHQPPCIGRLPIEQHALLATHFE